MEQFAELRHPKAGKPVAQYVYRDAEGNAVIIANRFHRSDGTKFFIPFDAAGGEWKAPEHRPLYRLPELIAANVDRPVILTEGEKCADALAGLGYVATTTFGGANAGHKADLSSLKGRKVIIWPDYDAPGAAYAEGIARALHRDHGTLARVLEINDDALCKVTRQTAATGQSPDITLHKGWDAADAVAQGWGVTEVNALLALGNDNPPLPGGDEATDAEVPLFDEIELWHDPDMTPFATIRRGNGRETFALDSRAFKRLLAHHHFKATGKTPTAAKLDDLTRQYIGQALYEGPAHPVFTRIGKGDDCYVLDLGSEDWSVIEITREGWRHRHRDMPRFKRSPGFAALPVPVSQTGGIDLLRQFVNLATEDDFRLIVGWLLACLRPEGPYPLLILTGEQGSAKSTTARVLKRLIDPATLDTRSFPGDERDLTIAAQNTFVLAFDNLSRIKPAMADALCRLATGGGFATRKLHSDADEVMFKASRPCILNGIPDLAERPDLADRAITIALPVIAETKRQYEAEFWAQFEAARPAILAALLDAVACALDKMDRVSLTERPRMADFAKWVTAASPAFGWPEQAFLAAYRANRREAQDVALEGNAVAGAILAMMATTETWRGTAAELVAHLVKCYPNFTANREAFPRQPNIFGAELRRIAPLVRSEGISMTPTRVGKERRRVMVIERV